ncbi:HEAT repeat domain-containing protein [Clostridium cylindrosporum]|uniref:Uncharacterized protein n=1 Tax=Clostridium cylindrosporum DSM 605 TaxID=1121307 RepID=A0A0J8DDA4_CLOCY|nr:HEAT repeat domain-containing protein [Clostridium cylindrosporum]KMT22218.1 hypothetical protein CLCY_4c01910 [Clostridium cylindrosporum DSM 605]
MGGTSFIIISLGVFSYVVICIMIYVGIARIKEKLENKKLKEIETGFGKFVLEHLEKTRNGIELSDIELNLVSDALDTPIYFKVFSKKYMEYANNENILFAKKYILNFQDKIVRIFSKVDRKSIMKFAYYIYLIGEFRINDKIINKILLENLNTESIYIRVNALKALSKIGDLNGFVDALRIISLRGLYFNEKIVIDSIDSFEGDIEELNLRLMEEMKNFTPQMINIVISHFSNTGYRKCSPLLIEKLKDKNTLKEVIMRIIKYFEVVKDIDSEPLIISMLDNPNWEVRVVASKAMLKYDVTKAEDKLRRLVSDNNYYVRYNTAMTLISKGRDYKLVQDIISGDDKFAKDIMFYAMFTKNFIDYDEYIAYKSHEENINLLSYESIIIDERGEVKV